MKRDNYSNLSFFHALDTAAIDATTTGKDVDTQGYESVTFAVTLGRCSHVSTLSYWALRLQHTDASALGLGPSDYADVASADLIGFSGAVTSGIWKKIITDIANSTSVAGSTNYQVGYIGTKRYVRLVVEELSTPSVLNIGAIAILGHGANWPVNTNFDVDDETGA